MQISASRLNRTRSALKVFIYAIYFLAYSYLPALASRNVSCLTQITAKVVSCNERIEEVRVSPAKLEAANLIDLEIEVISVDSVPACEYTQGQQIKLTIVRDDINTYNRVKRDVVIKLGTVLKGSIDHIVDEYGESYVFENISEVLN